MTDKDDFLCLRVGWGSGIHGCTTSHLRSWFAAGGNFRLRWRLDEILSDSAQEKLQFVLGDRAGNRVAQIVLVTVIFGAIFAAFFAFGDDVVLEGDAILVALHDYQLT